MKNEGYLDRFFRLILSVLILIVGFFWLGGYIRIIICIIGAYFIITSLSGNCLFYKLFKKSTYNKNKKVNKKVLFVFIIISFLIIIGGSYASIFFTKKIFLEDFNKMNAPYKLALFNTGQEKRTESIQYYNSYVIELINFKNKYQNYHPYVIMFDNNFNTDLKNAMDITNQVSFDVNSGNLTNAHKKLEEIRPLFNEILRRNKLSILSVVLVDFHDSMEIVLDKANAKDAEGVIIAYKDSDFKLKEVENELNEESIQTIRANLDAVYKIAIEGNIEELPKKASELKSSYVKVYLKLG
ncbi:MAG: DUF2892 domain-containing protein [Candidatus Pacearchaeota archaeon]|jgi:hypothetical protein